MTTKTLEQIDMMRARREAAETDIRPAHNHMAQAVARYRRTGIQPREGERPILDYDVCLHRTYQNKLKDIRDWAEKLLRRAEEEKE